MGTIRPYPKQDGFRRWLRDHGIKHTWAAKRLGYTKQYFSRVINGLDPLTDKFKRRCKEILEVPHDVWLEASE